MKLVFPRHVGRQWAIPKVQALTKFNTFKQRFDSTSNFFGGVGGSNHKTFVKDAGNNTQQQANNFTSQIELRYLGEWCVILQTKH